MLQNRTMAAAPVKRGGICLLMLLAVLAGSMMALPAANLRQTINFNRDGPGEFPTRPGIAFAPDSDIAIRDGMAAIKFRSYYAGNTLIHATSPGLKEATRQITTSLGTPKFIPGKTPPVKPRPYVRFTGTPTAGSLLTLGMNNPTRASSEAPGHSARLANDGNPATFWQAGAGDTNAWFQ